MKKIAAEAFVRPDENWRYAGRQDHPGRGRSYVMKKNRAL